MSSSQCLLDVAGDPGNQPTGQSPMRRFVSMRVPWHLEVMKWSIPLEGISNLTFLCQCIIQELKDSRNYNPLKPMGTSSLRGGTCIQFLDGAAVISQSKQLIGQCCVLRLGTTQLSLGSFCCPNCLWCLLSQINAWISQRIYLLQVPLEASQDSYLSCPFF